VTIREISEVAGKDERTIQRWVKRVAGKMSSMNDKMSASTSTYPADYDLEETVAIKEWENFKTASQAFINALSIWKWHRSYDPSFSLLGVAS
jgi:transposase